MNIAKSLLPLIKNLHSFLNKSVMLSLFVFLSPCFAEESDCWLFLVTDVPQKLNAKRYWAKPTHPILPPLPSHIALVIASNHWRDGIQAVGKLTTERNFLRTLKKSLGRPISCEELPSLPKDCTKKNGEVHFWTIPKNRMCYRAEWDDGTQGERWLFAFPPKGHHVYFEYRYTRE